MNNNHFRRHGDVNLHPITEEEFNAMKGIKKEGEIFQEFKLLTKEIEELEANAEHLKNVDGHNYQDIEDWIQIINFPMFAYSKEGLKKLNAEAPHIIIANTAKGKG